MCGQPSSQSRTPGFPARAVFSPIPMFATPPARQARALVCSPVQVDPAGGDIGHREGLAVVAGGVASVMRHQVDLEEKPGACSFQSAKVRTGIWCLSRLPAWVRARPFRRSSSERPAGRQRAPVTGHTISARRSDCARSASVCRSSSRRAISSRSSPLSITARSSGLHPVPAARVQPAAEHRELHPLAVTMQQPVDAAPPLSGRDVVGDQVLPSRRRHSRAGRPCRNPCRDLAAGAFGDLMPDAGSRRPGAGDPKAHAVRHPRRHALFSQLLRGGRRRRAGGWVDSRTDTP